MCRWLWMPLILLAATTTLTFSQQEVVLDLRTPAQQIALAAKDVLAADQETARYTRYLDIASFPPIEREIAFLMLSGHIQHLSRSPEIVRPTIVAGSSGSLLRLNLRDYRINVGVWERLSDMDPYYHQQYLKVVEWPGGYDTATKRHWEKGTYKERISRQASWLFAVSTKDLAAQRVAVSALIERTHSQVPIVRGDWFFWQTAIQSDRGPAGYYDFLGVKNLADFERIGGFDRKLFDGFSVEVRASVARSGVTLQPRAIARFPTLGGSYWSSYDFRLAVEQKNPLQVLGKDIEKQADARETFISLPNGMWATGAFNGKGDRQDSAPDFIASDSFSPNNDRRIHANLSCIRCHTNGGLKDIDDWTRNLIQPPLQANIFTYDPVTNKRLNFDALQRLRINYTKHLGPLLDRDRKPFADAVLEATGLKASDYTAKYGQFFSRFEDANVDLAWVERDTGIPRVRLLKALKASMTIGRGDPVLSVLTLEGERARSIPIRQWLEKIPTMYQLVEQYP